MDLGQKEHVERLPRTNPIIPIRSNKVGFVASPVGPRQCLYGEAEFPEPTIPIDPIDRPPMPWERLYDRHRPLCRADWHARDFFRSSVPTSQTCSANS